jgi:hypothetical protein
MRKIIVTVIFIIITIGAYSQDIITRTNGEVIKCKIQNEDSTFVYFKTFIKDKLIETHLPTSEISSIKYYSKPAVEIERREIVTKAIGMGLDYGGIVGFKVTVNLHDNVGIFGGVGWVFGLGYNVGAKISFAPKSKINPYIQAMYGNNARVVILDDSELNKIYYGGTVGFGFDFKLANRNECWSVGLQMSSSTGEAQRYMDYLEDERIAEFKNDISPILITVGYKF